MCSSATFFFYHFLSAIMYLQTVNVRLGEQLNKPRSCFDPNVTVFSTSFGETVFAWRYKKKDVNLQTFLYFNVKPFVATMYTQKV